MMSFHSSINSTNKSILSSLQLGFVFDPVLVSAWGTQLTTQQFQVNCLKVMNWKDKETFIFANENVSYYFVDYCLNIFSHYSFEYRYLLRYF